MKKLLSVFLCLTVWLSVSGGTNYDFKVGGIRYNIIGDGIVEVTSGESSSSSGSPYSGSVVIPSSVFYNGITYRVISIGDYAFRNGGVGSVTIPISVTSIGNFAFEDCSSLTSMTIPDSVIYIGESAFEKCSRLTSVTIGNSVTYIEESAFEGCTGLTSVDIPNSVTYIGESAFRGCSGLTSVTIPNSLTSIKSYTFYGCSSLTSVDIPNSVTSFGQSTFEGCTGLTSVTIPNSVTFISLDCFCGCSGLTSVTIGSGVTGIGFRAFNGCRSLTSVDIPNSVTCIEMFSFYNCTSLTSVTIGSGVTDIYDHAFACDSRLHIALIKCYAKTPPSISSESFGNYQATLYVPESSVSLYQSAEYWKHFNIQPLSDEPTQIEYSLADRNVVYCNDIVYNKDGLDIKLFDASGRMISSSNGDIEMSSYPNGIYIVTDGKGGFLKINHYR
ncbi:MAG: leucine-rich repeat domain-containing protein [bacterium]|nr:leucine-rich repeat domain-containing protein [Candidatus Minthenecus merdequi]MBQ0082877.1 leucine-rich repeat domain-containing protein [Candidatus Colousia faecequi]